MTCPTGQRLRLAWYATAIPVPDVRERDLLSISHSTDDYQAALDAYRNHRLTCPNCAGELIAEKDPQNGHQLLHR